MKIRIVRLLGWLVCWLRGHDFYHPCGCYDSRFAHSCLRCGALDRPLDSLSSAGLEDEDFYEDICGPSDEEIDADLERSRRWFSAFKYPRWI